MRAKLVAGEVRDANDLITLNLDLRQFAQDAIETCEGPDLLRAFWHAIEGVSVLDPTCGSGAFLFAALNILQPLYQACLDRMRAFVADLERGGEKHHRERYADFRAVLERLAAHPNEDYFVFKSIILRNLYGVDIMEEAVEICKLRLFLKLAAQVEPDACKPNMGMEPLPDVDFNVKAGNTLVGFATLDEAERPAGLDFTSALGRAKTVAADLGQATRVFRDRQLEADASVPGEDKAAIRRRLAELRDQLDRYLAGQYGVDVRDCGQYGRWHATVRPFHWCAEFHNTMASAGFDVVIGNPPYVHQSEISGYRVQGYSTAGCPDIYAPCVERALHLVSSRGRFAMILPISFQFSDDFAAARRVCERRLSDIWVSTFSRNPAALFSAGLGVCSTVCVGRAGTVASAVVRTSALNRWVEARRASVFQCVAYTEVPTALRAHGWPRLDGRGLAELFARLVQAGHRLDAPAGTGTHQLRFKTIALYYISAFVEDPPSHEPGGRQIVQTGIGALRFRDPSARDVAMVVALGKIALLWWAAVGDDFHVTASGLGSTPVDAHQLPPNDRAQLTTLSTAIAQSLANNVIYTKYAGKWMGNYDVKYVRDLTDRTDRLILQALNLEGHWEDIELAYDRFMKATGERPGTTREAPLFGVSGSRGDVTGLGDD